MKGSFVHGVVACHGALQDSAFTQSTVDFARHAGSEAGDFPIAQLNPFRVGSRKTNQIGARFQHTHGRSLLAAHHLR